MINRPNVRPLAYSSLAIALATSWTFAGAATPVASYSFEEGSGTTLTDRSGNNFHGTLRHGPIWSAGKYGTGLAFDGLDDHVRFTDIDALDSLGSVTVSAWVKFAQAGGGSHETHLVDKSHCSGYANQGPWELGVALTRSNKAEFVIYPQNGSPRAYLFSGPSITSVDDGNWHFITGRYDGKRLSIWVDGVQENSLYAPGLRMPNTTYVMDIGGNCNGYTYPFRGSLDDVRVYNRALTRTELQTDMVTPLGGGGSPPPPPPPNPEPPPPDSTPPTAPTGLTQGTVTSSQISFTWQASSDNVGVAGYRVFRNGSQVATTQNRSYTDSGLAANTAYVYTLYAYDAAGNTSASSSPLSATTATSSAPSAGSYSTQFNQDENPLSEGGRWQRANNQWTNVRTTGGVAYGTNGVIWTYDDSYALLSGFGPNQTGEATVFRNSSVARGDSHEVEILLRATDSPSSIRAYECLFNLEGNVALMRWNGPFGSFSALPTSVHHKLGRELITGDVVKCSISGTTISAYVNDVLLARGDDSEITSGQPGIGFFIRPNGSPLLLGLTNYTVTQQ